jgi:hypothetical protein
LHRGRHRVDHGGSFLVGGVFELCSGRAPVVPAIRWTRSNVAPIADNALRLR